MYKVEAKGRKMEKFIPSSTYRLQFNAKFTFNQATEIIPFLSALGISHIYSSPIFKAKEKSMHGYDVVDHSLINPEIGTEEEFNEFILALKKHKMGIICDIVPNHMFIMDPSNKWWGDVLENGPSSVYADYFDIDWHPPKSVLTNKVLYPVLDRQYGSALKNQDIKIIYDDGAFLIQLTRDILPTDPKSWAIILESAVKKIEQLLPPEDLQLLELKSIITAITHLPLMTELNKEKKEERSREKEVVKKRLSQLISSNKMIMDTVRGILEEINGERDDPKSFDRLEQFLNNQSYRLCFWRVANDEINYRRFFDILEFAGIRSERKEVFEAIHSLVFHWFEKEYIEGFRIDHIDGLWDPEQYLADLKASCKNIGEKDPYIIVEKVLIGKEKLPSKWPVAGTVGYDFLNQINGLFVAQSNKKAIFEIYHNFSRLNTEILSLVEECKKLVLLTSMSSELSVLARHLEKIAEQHRDSRDFTGESLRSALRDLISCFPVYRTYIRADEDVISEEDKQILFIAVERAKHLNPAMDTSIFDFIQHILFMEYPEGLNKNQIVERKKFLMRFQQLTGPVMAKGLEDTANYRFFPLASLNEIGSDLSTFGISLEVFHKKNQERCENWPLTMNTTSTHDTKRGEDTRARINVISEIPEEWEEAINRWAELNHSKKMQEGDEFIPTFNDEYLLYQTLVGTWPLQKMDAKEQTEYILRIQQYMQKAINEAKVNTSWINPNKKYNDGLEQFIQKILDFDSSNPFIKDIQLFTSRVRRAGLYNALSQILIKYTSPGVPDTYQGNELWAFLLVDPDNRINVEYNERLNLFHKIKLDEEKKIKNSFAEYFNSPENGLIKLYVTYKMLQLRKRLPGLFQRGLYIPLNTLGDKQNHLICYARVDESSVVIILAARFFISLLDREVLKTEIWNDTWIVLPQEWKHLKFKNLFTMEESFLEKSEEQFILKVGKTFANIPFGVLEGNPV